MLSPANTASRSGQALWIGCLLVTVIVLGAMTVFITTSIQQGAPAPMEWAEIGLFATTVGGTLSAGYITNRATYKPPAG